MVDMRQTIVPKSDQLNADDLIGTTKTVKVAAVRLCGEPDQPIAINYEGDGGKPYKPCKSMRRVLVNVWGADGAAYVGRSMTLYRDEGVQFGGMKVGGVRISHMSHINAPVTMALTETKARRKPYVVQPMASASDGGHRRTLSEALEEIGAALNECHTRAGIETVLESDLVKKVKAAAKGQAAEGLKAIMQAAIDRTAPVESDATPDPTAPDDIFPGDLPNKETA